MLRILFLTLSLLPANQLLAADKAGPIHTVYPLDQVTTNVYVVHGPAEPPSPENQGFINNPMFIVTTTGIVVFDPGSSVQTGEMLLTHIDNTSDKPVVAIFNTHVHGDHWLGNQAIAKRYPSAKIYGHPAMAKMIASGEAESWIDIMMNLTNGAILGTQPVAPTELLNDGDVIKIDQLSFHIIHKGKAHTETDIMILIPEVQLIYLGDNANQGFIVRMDGSVRGNIASLDNALATGAKVFVPGHGKTGDASVARTYREFLSIVYETAKAGYADGKADFEIRPELLPKLQKWQHWVGFENQLGAILNTAYLEAEAADFE